MNILQIAEREMIRRRHGILVNLSLVICVFSIMAAVGTLRDATAERVRRVMAQMGNNLLFIPNEAVIDNYYTATEPQATMQQSRAEYLATACPVMSHHATHYVAKYQRRVPVRESEVILTGFYVITGGHRPTEPKRRRGFLDDPLPAGHVIFGYEAARRTGVKTGDSVMMGGRSFEVSRVLNEFGILDDQRVWARLEEVQAIFDSAGRIHGVDALGCMCAGPYFEEIKVEIARSVPDLRFVHAEVVARTRVNSREAVEGIGAIVMGIVAILGAVAIFTTTAGEIRERRREIGVLQAMGAGSGHIALLLTPKLLIVGIIGGAFGWGIGSVLAVRIGPGLSGGMEDIVFRVLYDQLPAFIFMGLIFALLAGGLAVWKACRMDPVDALREL
ncbi:MAG: FtsX-like permease family protein [Planctomycetota bacterium]